jgi:hypothetical protein
MLLLITRPTLYTTNNNIVSEKSTQVMYTFENTHCGLKDSYFLVFLTVNYILTVMESLTRQHNGKMK